LKIFKKIFLYFKETATTATSDPAPSSNIIEDIDDSVSSASKKSAKRKRSAAIRAHEDGPEDEMTGKPR